MKIIKDQESKTLILKTKKDKNGMWFGELRNKITDSVLATTVQQDINELGGWYEEMKGFYFNN